MAPTKTSKNETRKKQEARERFRINLFVCFENVKYITMHVSVVLIVQCIICHIHTS